MKDEVWLPVDVRRGTRDDPVIFDHKINTDSAFTAPLQKVSAEAPPYFGSINLRLALALEHPLDRFRHALVNEGERGGLFIWQPVFLGFGCFIYFNLPREPLALAFPLLALVLAALVFKARRGSGIYAPLVAGLLTVIGICAAQLRTELVGTDMLSRPVIAVVEGQVRFVEKRADGRIRYTLDVVPGGLDHSSTMDFSGTIRLTDRKGGPAANIGDHLVGRARVAAPSGPAYPGGYSFAFQSWFDGIGGSGFYLGHPKLKSGQSGNNSWFEVAAVRANISNLIRDALPGRAGGLAAALIVGDRSGIDDLTSEALRRSGLAHILAISGLHMGLVAATVMSAMRLLFAFSPRLVLHFPVRKFAAASALFGASIYLLLSGANVSTQRAYIMVAVMLLAVLTDRRALTMRNVSLAAIIVLCLSPEAMLLPGFQMSFAAVAALVATYETLSARSQKTGYNQKLATRNLFIRLIRRDVGGLALTSLVAGIATGIFAAYHFHRIAPLGLLANLGAMPIVSIVVMPFALLSVLAMPFGLEAYPLFVMGHAVEAVVWVAEQVSQLGQGGNTGRISALSLVFAVFALLLLCLLKTRLRLFGIPLLCLSLGVQFQQTEPDILILENGKQIGILSKGEPLAFLRPRAEKFSTEIWKRAYRPEQVAGNVATETPAAKSVKKSAGFRCDELGCVAVVKGVTIANPKNKLSLLDDCQLADIIVASFDVSNICKSVAGNNGPIVLDRKRLKQFGSHAITIEAIGRGRAKLAEIQIEAAFGTKPRPWTRHRHED